MAEAAVMDIGSVSAFDETLKRSALIVCHFTASWCDACTQINKVLGELSLTHPLIQFIRVDAEKVAPIVERYDVSAVPYVVFFRNGAIADRLQGANVPQLVEQVQKFSSQNGHVAVKADGVAMSSSKKEEEEEEEAKVKKLQRLVNSNPIMLFMKGTAEEPRCGFSSRVVEILKGEGVEFSTFDIFSDQSVREGLKVFSNWPTYPQLYVEGELLGGCDIVKEMHESGELKTLFQEKGLLKKHGEAVATKEEEQAEEEGLEARLRRLVNSSPVMVFMKGTPSEPRCGFSRRVVNAIEEVGAEFGSFDILSDEEVRQGLKEFSNWPTYPQLYHKGEFIGGCDIVTELHSAGELKDILLA